MNADELTVCTYLKGFPGQFVSGKEVCRRAGGKRRAMNEPRWAIPVLKGLVEQRIVESDATGHFRFILKPQTKTAKKWVSPQVYRLLKASGRNFDEVFEIQTPLDSIPSLLGPKPKRRSRENIDNLTTKRPGADTSGQPDRFPSEKPSEGSGA